MEDQFEPGQQLEVMGKDEAPPEGATTGTAQHPDTGKWHNVYNENGKILRPKFHFEQIAYPDQETALSAIARRTQMEYDIQWRTANYKKRTLVMLGLLGAE